MISYAYFCVDWLRQQPKAGLKQSVVQTVLQKWALDKHHDRSSKDELPSCVLLPCSIIGHVYIYIIGNLGETTRANKNHASLLFVICAYELLSLQPLTSTSLKWHILFQSGHDKEFGTKRQIVLTCGWNYPCRFPENLTWKRESKAKNRGEQHISRLDACFWLIEGNNPWRPCFFCIIWRVFLSCLPFKTICTFAYAPCMECFLRYMIHVFFF